MAIKNRIAVKILGHDHYLISTDEPGYVEKVAKLVDDRMQVVFKSNSSLSHTKVAILTALNLADDLTKARRTIEELESRVKPECEDLEEAKEHVALLIDQVEGAETLYDDVLNQLKAMTKLKEREKTEMDRLLRELKVACGQEEALDQTRALLDAEAKIRDLEDKLQLRENELEEYIRVFDEMEEEQLQALEEEIIYEEELSE